MPEALLLTSTLVMGWILPVATTERATSPRVTLASLLGSMDDRETIRANPKPSSATITTIPAISQIQNFLLLRDAATRTSKDRIATHSCRNERRKSKSEAGKIA